MSRRFNWAGVFRRLSTWLSVTALIGVGGLAAYAAMPERAQLLMPDWLLATLAGVSIGSAALIPVATSLKQNAMVRASRRRSRQKRAKRSPVDIPAPEDVS